MRALKDGMWGLAVTAKYADGSPRRVYRKVKAASTRAATVQLAAFVAEIESAQAPDREQEGLTVDEAIDLYLAHLSEEKGREESTVTEYRKVHRRWFAPSIGDLKLARVDVATVERIFGQMRQAGMSRSRMNLAKSLYAPFFRWAKRRGMIMKNPMAEFELPTSKFVSRERVPPEVDELCLLLATAADVIPDVAPLLALGAVTGMRRGELAGIRQSRIDWDEAKITVDSSVAESGHLKSTKTRRVRAFHIDSETMAMLARHRDAMDERADLFGAVVDFEVFLFSSEPDCSRPMSPDYLTRRVRVLKGHLGIEDKTPASVAMENEALRLYRSRPAAFVAGRRGPPPAGAMSQQEIGVRLGRSEKWVGVAIRAAQRREAASAEGMGERRFDGSILALRKFTSSELLDAGFNISVVAQRQGHGPAVLARHYSKSRESADRKAAEHLGTVVHRGRTDQPRAQARSK